MRLRCLVIVLAILAASAPDSWGQSKQPATTPQQNAAQQDRGTENSPVVVRVIPPEKSQDELESEKAKRISDEQIVKLTGDLAWYTKLLFGATALLVLATAGLVISGLYQLRDARRQMAHDRQVERAYVFARVVTEAEQYPAMRSGTPTTVSAEYIEVALDNHGKTAGYIDDVAISSCIPEELPKPADLDADYKRSKWEMGVSIPPDGTDVRVPKRFELRAVKGHVVYGRVYYRDIFGGSHSSGFIRRVHNNGTPAPYHAAPEFTSWD
jgi:hypothetical protein